MIHEPNLRAVLWIRAQNYKKRRSETHNDVIYLFQNVFWNSTSRILHHFGNTSKSGYIETHVKVFKHPSTLIKDALVCDMPYNLFLYLTMDWSESDPICLRLVKMSHWEN